MTTALKISDFCITKDPVPLDVADKILEHHLRPLEKVNKAQPHLNARPSLRSCFRPRWYEIRKGREGNSQHCFFGKGADDITCDDFENEKDCLLETLIEQTEYTRFAVYRSFIHCDYAIQDERWVFNSKWKRQYRIDEPE